MGFMKILVVADEESTYLWDYYDESLFEDVSFIISAGDLKAKYLSFLTTVTKRAVFYVAGNHDHRYALNPPYGCDILDDHIVVYNGVRILGLGGSYRYKDGPYQYSERDMRQRFKKLQVLINQFNGFDILVTHAPAKGHGDGDDLCHTGFDIFNEIIHEYKPSYMLHGHQHLNYSHKSERIRKQDMTTIINGYNYYFFEYESNGYTYKKLYGFKRFFNNLRFFVKYGRSEQKKHYLKYRKYLATKDLS